MTLPGLPAAASRSRTVALAIATLTACCIASVASAQDKTQAHAGHALGTVHFPVSCTVRAQRDFDQALALLHHMTYPQARSAFAGLATRAPDCAMAHWGVAMTLFQPLWPTRPTPADLARGASEVAAARSAAGTSDREKLFIDAAAAFFDDEGQPDYWARIRRWEAATQRVHTALPNDDEATVFYALAHLAVAPANKDARANADRAAALLLPVYRRNPEHPGAMHYLVHANDVPGREHELLEIVRKYETVAPQNPHALHMPTHIYTRLGDWPAVIRGNLRAADAALQHPAGDRGQYVWDEFAHAIEYLVYAHLQQGDDAAALAQLRRLQVESRIEPSFKSAFHLSSTAARYALERGDWASAAQLPTRTPDTLAWDKFPWPEAVTWYARGVGAARLKPVSSTQDVDAQVAIARLVKLEESAKASGEDLFARSIGVLRLAVEGWRAQAQGEPDRARALLSEAAALEAATPKHAVTPGPTLPAEEQLGDLLMQQQRPAEARAAYERALKVYPERFNSLLGAARAAASSGDREGARKHLQHLLDIAKPGPRRSDAEAWAREALAAAGDE